MDLLHFLRIAGIAHLLVHPDLPLGKIVVGIVVVRRSGPLYHLFLDQAFHCKIMMCWGYTTEF